MNRRQFLQGLAAMCLGGMVVTGTRLWPESGFKASCLSGMPEYLSQHPLMQEIWQGIQPANVWDSHVHLTGSGDSQHGVWMNANMNSWLHPVLKVQKDFYMDGSCSVLGDVDRTYVYRLAALTAEMPAGFKSMLFAFDWYHDMQGHPVKENSIFYISNEYTAKVASDHPKCFEWVASIHPYRQDALDALDTAKAQGARAVKWLPSGMGIDPASPDAMPFTKRRQR